MKPLDILKIIHENAFEIGGGRVGLDEGDWLLLVEALKESAVPKDLEIHKMLTLSTGHVRKSTAQLFELNTDDVPIFFEKKPWGERDGDGYGWFIPIIKDEPFPHTCPDELVKVREFAEAQGCTWIMFDRDADTIDDLPTWDW